MTDGDVRIGLQDLVTVLGGIPIEHVGARGIVTNALGGLRGYEALMEELLRTGQKILAIKLHRAWYMVSLKDAKDAVERLIGRDATFLRLTDGTLPEFLLLSHHEVLSMYRANTIDHIALTNPRDIIIVKGVNERTDGTWVYSAVGWEKETRASEICDLITQKIRSCCGDLAKEMRGNGTTAPTDSL